MQVRVVGRCVICEKGGKKKFGANNPAAIAAVPQRCGLLKEAAISEEEEPLESVVSCVCVCVHVKKCESFSYGAEKKRVFPATDGFPSVQGKEVVVPASEK